MKKIIFAVLLLISLIFLSPFHANVFADIAYTDGFGKLKISSVQPSVGILDPTFGNNGVVSTPVGSGNAVAQAVAVQPDGKIIAAGFANNGSNNDFAILRYNPDGTLDDTFRGDSPIGTGVILTPIGLSDDEAFGITLQDDGKIIAVGQSRNGTKTDVAVVRCNPDGTLDNTFDVDGLMTVSPSVGSALARSVDVQADGRIVVAGVGNNGSNFDNVVIRLMPDGSLDPAFVGNSGTGNGIVITTVGAGNEQAYAVSVLPSGKILVAGYFAAAVSNDTVLLRHESDGRLDSTFGVGGIAVHSFSPDSTDEALSMALQPDGRIVIAGCIRTPGIANDFLIARFEENGSRDTAFGNGGFLVVPFGSLADIASGVAIQADGKIVAVGFGNNGIDTDYAVTRVNTDGTFDSAFGNGGRLLTMVGQSFDAANAVALQSNGRIVVAGRTASNVANIGIVRYVASAASISGRVLTPAGRGLGKARVNLIDAQGVSRAATTSTFGYYKFENIAVGQTYSINVSSKIYEFMPLQIAVNDSLADVDFVGMERR
ncbi:MAG: carboxypeptidase regulatory-like domain-containing protein [Pyrinomonadaceae bacterium]